MAFDLSTLPLVRLTDEILYLPISTDANGNALDEEAMQQSIAALNALDSLEISAKVVVLCGLGKNFSVGGNVRGFAAAEDVHSHILDVAQVAHTLVRRIDALELPVIAAMSGWAAGAGLSLALAADFTVGGPGTKCAFAYSAIGLSPDGGMSYFLPRVVGRIRAATLLMTSAKLDGAEARDMGIISVWAEDDDVTAAADELARRLAAGPANSYRSIKQSLRVSEEGTLDAVLRTERYNIAANAAHPNGVEGVAAFTGKRAPQFPNP